MSRVPNTETFSLQDVVNITGGSSLSAAFTNANQGYFDSSYNNDSYAPPQSLKRFRNYGVPGISKINTKTIVNDKAISSIEISASGNYIFLLYPGLFELRRYTLSTPFDITTMSSSYQLLDISFISRLTYIGGLYLCPNDKYIFIVSDTMTDSKIWTLTFGNNTDLSSYEGYSSIISNNIDGRHIAFDPTGYIVTISGVGTSISNTMRSYDLSVPFVLSSISYMYSASNSNYSSVSFEGFEFNFDGSQYYQILNDHFMPPFVGEIMTLTSFGISPNYLPTGNTYETSNNLIYKPSSNARLTDFCFSRNKSTMYVVWFDLKYDNSIGWYYTVFIEQYSI